jgi:hypothetical protein
MRKILVVLCALVWVVTANAQIFGDEPASVTGSFQLNAQVYKPDSIIGADTVAEKLLSNSYMNVIYTKGAFSAGVRFEGYYNAMLGHQSNFDGFGIANRYATYDGGFAEVTMGNFYEQFGNGLVFRAYENRDLGYDNSVDGARIKLRPLQGIIFTGFIGKQRDYWAISDGIVRGVDGDFSINEIFKGLAESKHRVTLGGSVVSKYQKDEDPILILPENVASGAGRLSYAFGGFALNSEYAFKSQDPSADNGSIYKYGSAMITNLTYSQKGFGVMIQSKWVDNMSFRSDRNQSLNRLLINSLPAISKNHAYAFAAMYPYATVPTGEAGVQGEIFYKFSKGSLLGGKYGTMVTLNYSLVNDIDKQLPEGQLDTKAGTDGYTTDFLSIGDEVLLRDFNADISKKLSKKVKGTLTYQNIVFNQARMQGHGDMVNANTFIADVTLKLKRKHALRIEGQLLTVKMDSVEHEGKKVWQKQDKGDWAMLMLEYTISPNWFFSLSDQYNYGNPVDEYKTHYYSAAFGYTKNSTRFEMRYGRQRKGVLCVGGVCREVPAANGLYVSIKTNF